MIDFTEPMTPAEVAQLRYDLRIDQVDLAYIQNPWQDKREIVSAREAMAVKSMIQDNRRPSMVITEDMIEAAVTHYLETNQLQG